MLVARTSSHQSRMDVKNSTGYQFIKTENLFAFSVSLYYFYYYYSYVTASFLLTRVTVACTVVAVAVAIFFFLLFFWVKILGLSIRLGPRCRIRQTFDACFWFGVTSSMKVYKSDGNATTLRRSIQLLLPFNKEKKKTCWLRCVLNTFFFLFQKYIKMQMSLDFESPERAVEWAKWWMFAERARL